MLSVNFYLSTSKVHIAPIWVIPLHLITTRDNVAANSTHVTIPAN